MGKSYDDKDRRHQERSLHRSLPTLTLVHAFNHHPESIYHLCVTESSLSGAVAYAATLEPVLFDRSSPKGIDRTAYCAPFEELVRLVNRRHFLLRKTKTILLGTLLFLSPAWAWFAEGHEIVAVVAADDLTPAARSNVARILDMPADMLSVEKSM